MSSKECTCCACDPSVHIGAHTIGFVYVFVCRKLSPYVVSLCDFAYYVVG